MQQGGLFITRVTDDWVNPNQKNSDKGQSQTWVYWMIYVKIQIRFNALKNVICESPSQKYLH